MIFMVTGGCYGRDGVGMAREQVDLLNEALPPSKFVGEWVQAPANGLGFGFCKGMRDSSTALIAYTDIPDVAVSEQLVPIANLRMPRISPGTRVWFRGSVYGWQAGEVIAATGFGEYHVRVAGERGRDRKVHGSRLVLRWNKQLQDPVKALAHGLCDSPEYYAARRAFRDQLIEQRSASRGFTAVLSAPVQFYQHQLDTVARVLTDPVLRYLLADEVGLGKTVEAGLVLRQLLLDDIAMRALVAAPTTLVRQWEEELAERLLLGDAIERRRLEVVSHEELLDRHDLRDLGLVVVDEAHHVVHRLTQSVREDLYRTRGLLLLSATPMRGNLGTFLGLLNLVDPLAFPTGDLVGFGERVRARESAASSVQVLAARRPTVRQRVAAVERLSALHGSDPVFARIAEQCTATADPNSSCWTALAEYVRETYRISRRMIRHRRNSGPAVGYPVAGRKATFVSFADPARPAIDDFLDAYRERFGPSLSPRLYAHIVMNGLAGPGPLLDRLTEVLDTSGGIRESVRSLIETTVARLQLAGINSRLDAALRVVADRVDAGQKVVVVGTSRQSADRFLESAASLWHDRVRGHVKSMAQWERDEGVAHFLESPGAQVLVGDFTLEEGRNLQDAHVLVNIDLPLDPNRLEQRIGRLDRFARRSSPAEVVVLTEPASAWVSAQIAMFERGIGIFDASVATLQRRLTDLLEELVDSLGVDGNAAFTHDLDGLRVALDDERNEVDLLEEIESTTVAADFDNVSIHSLRRVDADVNGLRRAFEQLTTLRGGIALRPVENKHGLLRFERDTGRLGQARVKRIGGLAEDMSQEVNDLLDRVDDYAYARDTAVGRGSTFPLRLGNPLVDWIERYLRTDERGRTRAVVRPTNAVRTPELWLNCDFLVEYDDSHLSGWSEEIRRRLRRRGDAHLPPAVIRTWTDAHGVAEPTLMRHLDAPFDEGRDHVLRGPLWEPVLAALPEWRPLCDLSYRQAMSYMRSTAELTTVPAAAGERAAVEVAARMAVLRARSHRLPTQAERDGAEKDMLMEEDLGRALVRGVSEPAVSVIACGGVVLWPTP